MCSGRGSNQGPLGPKSDALTTAHTHRYCHLKLRAPTQLPTQFVPKTVKHETILPMISSVKSQGLYASTQLNTAATAGNQTAVCLVASALVSLKLFWTFEHSEFLLKTEYLVFNCKSYSPWDLTDDIIDRMVSCLTVFGTN